MLSAQVPREWVGNAQDGRDGNGRWPLLTGASQERPKNGGFALRNRKAIYGFGVGVLERGIWEGRMLSRLLTLTICLPLLPSLAEAEGLDEKAKALQLIADFAHQMCYVISSKGNSSDKEIKGAVNVQLNGLASKLGDAGIQGTGKITNSEYQNVLREQLAKSIGDSAACNLRVLEILRGTLLDNPQSGPKDAESDLPARHAETDATRVRSFQFETPPTEYKHGSRKWARIAPDVWEQTYPDGTKQLNHVVKRIHVGDCDGTVINGKPDLDFQAFFPDKNCPDKEFMFRRVSQGNQWHAYVHIDAMQ